MTPRQRELLAFIRDTIDNTGCAPTYRQMAAAAGHASVSSVKRMVDRLIEQGHIDRCQANRARNLRLRGGREHGLDLHAVPTSALAAELSRREAVS